MKRLFALLALLITGCVPTTNKVYIPKQITTQNLFNMDDYQYLTYFYSEYCRHCQNIKDEIDDFTKTTDISFYYFCVDDQEITYSNNKDGVIGVSTLHNFYIVGTPSLVLFINNTVTEYYLGENEILEYISFAK